MSEEPSGRYEAILYDWHNNLRLSRQNQDIAFWTRVVSGSDVVALMGAGTGRLAVPMAERLNSVLAIDLSRDRLGRIRSDRVQCIEGDFRTVSLPTPVQHVIFPYSSMQLIPSPADIRLAVENALLHLDRGGQVWIDVSSNFAQRVDKPWHKAVEGNCDELGGVVAEWNQEVMHADHYELNKRFSLDDQHLLSVSEFWYFHPHSVISSVLDAVRCEWSMQRGYDEFEIDRDTSRCVARSAGQIG